MKFRKKMIFYNFIMFIIPLIVSIFVFESAVLYMNSKYLKYNNQNQYYLTGASEIINYINQTENFTIEKIENKCKEYDFSIFILDKNKDIFYENTTNDNKKIIESLNVSSNEGIVYQLNNRTVVTKIMNINGNTYYFYALSKLNELPIISTSVLKTALLFILLLPFISVVICNLLVTNKMSSSLVTPLKLLAQNANRIRRGDLNTAVSNADYEELNELCIAFNAMRIQLKENVDKNVLYENNRQELIAGISHDIKTPLTVIQGYAKGLLDGVANNEERKQLYLETIYRKSFEMEALLNQLTLFSKLETKALAFSFEHKNLHQYLSKFIKQYNLENSIDKIMINYNNRCKNVIVNIDINQMNRVLSNIITNSIKYNDKKLIIIDINCYKEDNKVFITIADNGIGVSDKNINYIFDSFYRVDTSRSSKIEGNGLGLSISKYIIEAHNGEISALSKDGLTIKIVLPIGEEDNERTR